MQNGLYNALPHMAKFITSFVFAAISDFMLRNKCFHVTTIRKIMQTFGKSPKFREH